MTHISEKPHASHSRHTEGSSGLTVVLITGVLIITAITTSMSVGNTSRRVVRDSTANYQALLSAESGLGQFAARVSEKPLGNWNAKCVSGGVNTETSALNAAKCTLESWMKEPLSDGSVLGAFTTGTGSVALRALNISVTNYGSTTPDFQISGMDIEATGTSGGAQSRLLRRYYVQRKDLPNISIPGAVTSYPGVRMVGGAIVDGTDLNSTSNTGLYRNFVSLNANNPSAPLVPGVPITLNPTNTREKQRISQMPVGSFFQMPTRTVSGTAGSPVTMRVTSNAAGMLQATPVNLPTLGSLLPPNSPAGIDLIYNGILSASSNELRMQTRESFSAGNSFKTTIGGVTYTGVVSSVLVNSGNIAIKNPDTGQRNLNGDGSITHRDGSKLWPDGSWSYPVNSWKPGPPAILPGTQGTPVIKSTYGIVTPNDYTAGKNSPVGSVLVGAAADAIVPSPMNDALFYQTFKMSPSELKAAATRITEGSFDGNVSGLMWMNSDGNVNLNSVKPKGKGILVVEGDLTINQNRGSQCELSGIIYVRGNLNIQGNLEMCGGIVVEGSVIDQRTGAVMGEDESQTQFGGNGRKITYDSKMIMDVASSAGSYTFNSEAGSWRQR